MIRRGELNPFELKNLLSATAHDYASTTIALLNTMRGDLAKRDEGLLRIKRWIERVLAGEITPGQDPAWSGAPAATPAVPSDEAAADEPDEDAPADDDEPDSSAETDSDDDGGDDES